MNTTDTQSLLRAYVRDHSEAAFTELVNRYIDLVYSVAIRRVSGDTLLAEDVTQMVFTDLARKAASLPPDIMLGGWLHRHSGFVAASAVRGEQRRRNRERMAIEMNALDQSTDSDWNQLAPVLDEVMDELDPADRDALVLRFFEGRDLRSIGTAMGASEDAAQKRVSRALEKVRILVAERQKVTISGAALGLLLGSHAVKAAPTDLAIRVATAALAGVALASAAGLVGSVLKVLTPATLKLLIGTAVVGAAILFSIKALNPTHQPVRQPESSAAHSLRPTLTNSEALAQATNTTVAAAVPATATSNQLHLIILAADSGKPVPNVMIDYRGRQGEKFTNKTLSANRVGECVIALAPETMTELDLTTRIDGFADTRLLWHPDRGEEIPLSYTLRLARPVAIGGLVVDPDGRPVAGAKVGFNHGDDPASAALPESHEFGWIEVSADASGRWSINRIAREMIRRLYGSAKHPDYVESSLASVANDGGVERKLCEGTYTFQLGRAVVARGLVVGSDGLPIPEAKVLVGKRGMSDSRQGKSEPDGTFAVEGCRPGKTLLSAEAEGFSATTLEIELNPDSEPFRVTLQRGNILRLRVVNRAGQPIPKANLWLDTMHHRPINAPDYGALPVQADFNRTTDAQGRMVWSNAPNAELDFDIAASGYMRIDQVKVQADGQEHVITLAPALVITGTMRDADTGEPIPRFRIVTGWPQTDYPQGTVHGNWPTIDRYWVNFSGGKFRHVLEEAAIGGNANPGYILKFEAEGYAPFVSRVIAPDEGSVQLDVTLHPAATTLVTALLPDGKPAALVDIGLVSPGARLQLSPGGFSRQGGSGSASLLRADSKGQFRLFGDPAVTRVIAAHPVGYAEASPTVLAADPILNLQPWGRLAGTFLSGGRPSADCELMLQFPQEDLNAISFDFITFRVKTDTQGNFLFPKVPAGKYKIIRLVFQAPNSFAHQSLPDPEIEIRPGETSTVTLGGNGYTVRAHARWPAGVTPDKNWHLMASVHTALPPALAELDKDQDPSAVASLKASPEMQEFMRTARNFQAAVASDYTLTVENVPAGDYLLSILGIFESAQGKRPSFSVYSYLPLSIPADPPNGSLDLGEVVLRKQEQANGQ